MKESDYYLQQLKANVRQQLRDCDDEIAKGENWMAILWIVLGFVILAVSVFFALSWK